MYICTNKSDKKPITLKINIMKSNLLKKENLKKAADFLTVTSYLMFTVYGLYIISFCAMKMS